MRGRSGGFRSRRASAGRSAGARQTWAIAAANRSRCDGSEKSRCGSLTTRRLSAGQSARAAALLQRARRGGSRELTSGCGRLEPAVRAAGDRAARPAGSRRAPARRNRRGATTRWRCFPAAAARGRPCRGSFRRRGRTAARAAALDERGLELRRPCRRASGIRGPTAGRSCEFGRARAWAMERTLCDAEGEFDAGFVRACGALRPRTGRHALEAGVGLVLGRPDGAGPAHHARRG